MKHPENPLFEASYPYTPELLHSFVKIHLWYQKKQHPLFLVTPGLFLLGCILWRLIPALTGAAELSPGKRLEIGLMFVFAFFILWTGLIHPILFEKALRDTLNQAGEKQIDIRFYDDRLNADSALARTECLYRNIHRVYITSDCIYLYIAPEQALPVPFHSMEGQDAAAFQKFLLSRVPSGRVSVKGHITIPKA